MRFTPLLALAASAVTSFTLASPYAAAETPLTGAQATATAADTPTQIRFATFNVRTARADIGTPRHWLHRALPVAREINSRNPGIAAIQELGPGRADGLATSLNGTPRQTESLKAALDSVGASRYKLARTTAYVAPGTSHGTQGARLLYDTSRYSLISNCLETTGTKNYNSSCAMDLPVMSGDTASKRRSAAYAEFEDRGTGQNFFVISAHLDPRHSSTLSKEQAYDSLRAAQARAVYSRVTSLAAGKPILFGGDINSWRTKAGSHAPFNFLTSQGFGDSTTAPSRVNAQYPTVNHFKTTITANATGRQVALDVVMAKGAASFTTYENVMKVVNASRPSDHNLVVSDLVL